jgi:hypothetical protein
MIYTKLQEEAAIKGKGFAELCIGLNELTWRERGKLDPRRVLFAVLNIGGALHNLIALEVEERYSLMVVMDPDWPEDILWPAFKMEGHAETVNIEGRRYAVFACPFCE